MEIFADDYENLAENITKTVADAKEDLHVFKESLQNETIRFKDNLKVEIDLEKAEIDTFKDNCTDELNIYQENLKSEIDDKKVEMDLHKQKVTDNLDSFMKNITTDVKKEIAELDLLEGNAQDSRLNETILDVKLGNPTVAFNVHNPLDRSIGTDEIFQYADVLLNKGDGYNVTEGKFFAPLAGLYYFSAHVCAIAGKFVHYGIVVGDEVRAVSSTREDTDSSCGSTSVVATVGGGEEVYVKCLSGNSYEAQLSENDYRWNSFVGALLQ